MKYNLAYRVTENRTILSDYTLAIAFYNNNCNTVKFDGRTMDRTVHLMVNSCPYTMRTIKILVIHNEPFDSCICTGYFRKLINQKKIHLFITICMTVVTESGVGLILSALLLNILSVRCYSVRKKYTSYTPALAPWVVLKIANFRPLHCSTLLYEPT